MKMTVDGYEFNMTSANSTFTEVPTTITDLLNVSVQYVTRNSSDNRHTTEWVMSKTCYVVTLTLLSLEAAMALLSNALLIVTIRYSPSLKTPSNSQLVSICVNNLLLVLNMMLGLVSLNISSSPHPRTQRGMWVLEDAQLFLTSTCWLQYWCIFSAIGFYRCTTLRRPSTSITTRKTIIYRSIWIGWLLSVVSGLTLTSVFRSSQSVISWNPFRRRFVSRGLHPLSLYQSVVLMLLFGVFAVGLGILLTSYYRIFRMLYMNRPLCQNRVYPLMRTVSLSSEENDLTVAAVRPRHRAPSVDLSSAALFTISDNADTVHFQKMDNSMCMDGLSLEKPVPTQDYPARVAPPTGGAHPDFTDISPSGELQRAHKVKATCTLRSQSIKNDRVSLGGATKNSLVMLLTYFLFSLPMVICAIPGVLAADCPDTVALTLPFTRLIFFINSPAYPVWYLIFSRRVRKCLHRLLKRTPIKLGLCV